MPPTHEQILDRHDRAFAVLDEVVRGVAPEAWQTPSPCPGWTARDVLSHLLWGQALIAAWATGHDSPDPPRDWTGQTSDAGLSKLWAEQRAASRSLLRPEALDTAVSTRAFGSVPLGAFLWTFPNDALLHGWDIAQSTGQAIAIPTDLAEWFLTWCLDHEGVLRQPGGFGPAVAIVRTASVTDRWLAFAGRDPLARPQLTTHGDAD